MAKQAAGKNEAKQSGRTKRLLTKRITPAKGGKLGRDVKAPRWLKAIGDYFTGSWQELRQVRWPTRRAALGLTLAVLIFTLAISAFILALDQLFELLFKQVIL